MLMPPIGFAPNIRAEKPAAYGRRDGHAKTSTNVLDNAPLHRSIMNAVGNSAMAEIRQIETDGSRPLVDVSVMAWKNGFLPFRAKSSLSGHDNNAEICGLINTGLRERMATSLALMLAVAPVTLAPPAPPAAHFDFVCNLRSYMGDDGKISGSVEQVESPPVGWTTWLIIKSNVNWLPSTDYKSSSMDRLII